MDEKWSANRLATSRGESTTGPFAVKQLGCCDVERSGSHMPKIPWGQFWPSLRCTRHILLMSTINSGLQIWLVGLPQLQCSGTLGTASPPEKTSLEPGGFNDV